MAMTLNDKTAIAVIRTQNGVQLALKSSAEIRILDRSADELPDALSELNRNKKLIEDGRPLPRSADFDYLPPLASQSRIFCVGRNYRDHAIEVKSPPPEHPSVFLRIRESLVGHHARLQSPRASDQYDFEGEIAAIIGEHVDTVSETSAFDAIAGYTLLMDGSVRDYQKHSLLAGKNFFATGAVGPAVTPATTIQDPGSIGLETLVNGEIVQSGRLSELIFSVPSLISYLSHITPLRPGDVISTGTPAGVGMARTPPLWLKAGDEVEVRSDQLGRLRNKIV